MKSADGPGDRWPRAIGAGGKSGHRRRRLARAGDEHPSAALRRLQGNPSSPFRGLGVKRATRLVTPGDGHAGSAAKWSFPPELNTWTGGVGFNPTRCGSVTESATENIPPAEQHGGIAQGNLRDVFASSGLTAREKLNRLARVKRWGKSPPSR